MITNLPTVTDAKNQIATYTYDNMARLKMRADALNRVEIYSYDFANVAATFEPRGC